MGAVEGILTDSTLQGLSATTELKGATKSSASFRIADAEVRGGGDDGILFSSVAAAGRW